MNPAARLCVAPATLLFALAGACSPEAGGRGPLDGEDLPPTDISRVAVGTVAPDFRLASYSGDDLALSDFRGRPLVLVFYRGHW